MLLESVIARFGLETKTEAVNYALRELLDRFPLTDLVTCGVVQAEVLREVKSVKTRDREGKVLPLPDLLIATCALREGALVLTADRHFDHIPNLNVLRPEND